MILPLTRCSYCSKFFEQKIRQSCIVFGSSNKVLRIIHRKFVLNFFRPSAGGALLIWNFFWPLLLLFDFANGADT